MHWSRDPQYSPMAPTLVRAPFHRDGWVFEEKVDGWRILAYKDGARVRLVSRNGRDHTRRFRDLAAAISKLSAPGERRRRKQHLARRRHLKAVKRRAPRFPSAMEPPR
jgi:ATP-dependent DNA ligase